MNKRHKFLALLIILLTFIPSTSGMKFNTPQSIQCCSAYDENVVLY